MDSAGNSKMGPVALWHLIWRFVKVGPYLIRTTPPRISLRDPLTKRKNLPTANYGHSSGLQSLCPLCSSGVGDSAGGLDQRAL